MRYTPRYFTDEQIQAAMTAWGLPDRCADPDALRAGAAIEAAAVEVAAEQQAAAGQAAAGPAAG